MGHPKPWTAAALAVLHDGEWHARETVIAAGVKKVPPGVAYRKGESGRRRGESRNGVLAPAVRTKGDDNSSIRRGARQRVANNLCTLTRHGRIERAVVDGVDCLRLTSAQAQAS